MVHSTLEATQNTAGSEARQAAWPDQVLQPHVDGQHKIVGAGGCSEQQANEEHEGVAASLARLLYLGGETQRRWPGLQHHKRKLLSLKTTLALSGREKTSAITVKCVCAFKLLLATPFGP